MDVYIDIETIPSQRKEAKAIAAKKVSRPGNISKLETIAKWEEEKRPDLEEEMWRKTALDGGWGEVVCVCWALDDGPVEWFSFPQNTITEAELIYNFFNEMIDIRFSNNMREIHWVGHNITGFDLRFIWQRAIVLVVEPTVKLRQNAKPWSDQVFDTMHQWDSRNFTKLTDLCEALSIDVGHEDTIDGSQVWDCYKEGKHQLILDHCIADVKRVREVHRRMTFKEAAE